LAPGTHLACRVGRRAPADLTSAPRSLTLFAWLIGHQSDNQLSVLFFRNKSAPTNSISEQISTNQQHFRTNQH
jgi:hypothetical protein